MKKILAPSELVINPDGSIYHLNLCPEDIGDFIITVGDPNRVPHVSKYFDRIEIQKEKREFITHTGHLGDKRITVISTGIGPDNIDIVLNELDALANIDLNTRTISAVHRSLTIVRIGTTGCLQPSIPVDSVVCSSMGLGFDNLLHFYERTLSSAEQTLAQDWSDFMLAEKLSIPVVPYPVAASGELLKNIGEGYPQGITITAPGFYAPQGRQLRAGSLLNAKALDRLHEFRSGENKIINLEMETSAIYGLSNILGHRALSCSVILANRASNTFSTAPKQAMDQLIQQVLGRIADL